MAPGLHTRLWCRQWFKGKCAVSTTSSKSTVTLWGFVYRERNKRQGRVWLHSIALLEAKKILSSNLQTTQYPRMQPNTPIHNLHRANVLSVGKDVENSLLCNCLLDCKIPQAICILRKKYLADIWFKDVESSLLCNCLLDCKIPQAICILRKKYLADIWLRYMWLTITRNSISTMPMLRVEITTKSITYSNVSLLVWLVHQRNHCHDK